MHLKTRMRSFGFPFRSGVTVLSVGALVAFALWAGNDSTRAVSQRESVATPTPGTENSDAYLSVAAEASAGAPRPAGTSTSAQYLRKIDALARSDKAAALALAQDPVAEFPERGVFAEAREALSITLLVDLGRMTEARDEVRRFIQSHPQSRYRPLVQGVTGIHPRPTRPQNL